MTVFTRKEYIFGRTQVLRIELDLSPSLVPLEAGVPGLCGQELQHLTVSPSPNGQPVDMMRETAINTMIKTMINFIQVRVTMKFYLTTISRYQLDKIHKELTRR
jgi:hypothetical protein